MQASNPLLDDFLRIAHLAADAADRIVQNYYRTALSSQAKSDASPVTKADQEVERAIRDIIAQHYPEHGIIGEEQANTNEGAGYQWVIDPIDGTRAFMAGYPLFTSLIALAHEGTPQLGVVSQAILKERWAATDSQKTTYNTALVNTRACDDLSRCVVASTSADYFTEGQSHAYNSLKSSCAQHITGGDAYAYMMLANGQLDMVVDAGMKVFDYAALAPVIAQAGGIITDWSGAPLTLHSKGDVIASANAQLHAQALAFLCAA